MPEQQAQRRPKKLILKPNVPYYCSFNMLLKLLEFALSLVSLAVSLRFDGNGAIVTVEILSTLALVTAFSWCVLYAINMNASFPEFFPLLMVIYHLLMFIIMVVVTGCSAYLWPQFKISIYPQYLVCTITSAAAALIFLIDTFLSVQWMRGSSGDLVVYPCYDYDPHAVY